jgi:hypothetical protein
MHFNVRGVPVSSGGSDTYNCRRMDYQVMLFGDTSFGNADNWLRTLT